MRTKNEDQKVIFTVDEFIESEIGGPIKKKMLIDYDLHGLKSLIELGGMDELISNLKTLYEELVKETLMSIEKGKYGIFENNPGFDNQMFYLKELVQIFEGAQSDTYEHKLKEFPVVSV